ncbi:hypothetical protein NFI96_026785, partial [Prochilodus magdalenae]
AKVRELEERCRTQSEQFNLLSKELEKFRLQAGKFDILSSSHLSGGDSPGSPTKTPSLSQLLNGLAAPAKKGNEGSLSKSVISEFIRPLQMSGGEKAELLSVKPSFLSRSTPSSPRRAFLSEVRPVIAAAMDKELNLSPRAKPRYTGKVRLCVARYNYNPYDGPNEHPEAELPLVAGKYLYIYGTMDEDGFYEGELLDGQQGLVPSNFVDFLQDEDPLSAASLSERLKESSYLNHSPASLGSSSAVSTLSTLLSEKLEALGSCTGTGTSSSSGVSSLGPTLGPSLGLGLGLGLSHHSLGSGDLLGPCSNGSGTATLDLSIDEIGEDVVPYPRRITLIKQLAKSVIVSWDPPVVPPGWGSISGYNVLVDQEVRMSVPFGARTKSLIEKLNLATCAHRISVQSVTDRGPSDPMRCTLLVGKDVVVAPHCLRVDNVTQTSAELSWMPSNSNYSHAIFLNDTEYDVVKPGNYRYRFYNLKPMTMYKVRAVAKPHQMPWQLPLEQREKREISVEFCTQAAGPPLPPQDVQVHCGQSPGVLQVRWKPPTLTPSGTSNGANVIGYVVCTKGQKIAEVMFPTAEYVTVEVNRIQCLEAREVVVRTISSQGESQDSNTAAIPHNLLAAPPHSHPPPHPQPHPPPPPYPQSYPPTHPQPHLQQPVPHPLSHPPPLHPQHPHPPPPPPPQHPHMHPPPSPHPIPKHKLLPSARDPHAKESEPARRPWDPHPRAPSPLPLPTPGGHGLEPPPHPEGRRSPSPQRILPQPQGAPIPNTVARAMARQAAQRNSPNNRNTVLRYPTTGPPQGHHRTTTEQSYISGHRTIPHRTLPHRTLPHRMLPTGRYPTGCCLQDAAYRMLPHRTLPHRTLPHRTLPHRTLPHRMLPTGRCLQDAAPQDAAPQDAAHRTLPHRTLPHRTLPHRTGSSAAAQCSVGHPLVISGHRTLPHRTLPHRTLPHRTLPHWTLPTGRCPTGRCLQDATPQDATPLDSAYRTLPHKTQPTGRYPTGRYPTGLCLQDAAPQDAAPQDATPQDAAYRTLPHRTLPTGRCPTRRCPQDAANWIVWLVDDSQSSSDTEVSSSTAVSDSLTPAPHTLTHHHHTERRNVFSDRSNALHSLNSDEEEDGYDSPQARRRGASVDEFLRGSELGRQHHHYSQSHSEEYYTESSRGSDLSDIMEEDEEELYSEMQLEEGRRRSINSHNTLKAYYRRQDLAGVDEQDSWDLQREVVRQRSLRSHKRLHSIPEVAEEEPPDAGPEVMGQRLRFEEARPGTSRVYQQDQQQQQADHLSPGKGVRKLQRQRSSPRYTSLEGSLGPGGPGSPRGLGWSSSSRQTTKSPDSGLDCGSEEEGSLGYRGSYHYHYHSSPLRVGSGPNMRIIHSEGPVERRALAAGRKRTLTRQSSVEEDFLDAAELRSHYYRPHHHLHHHHHLLLRHPQRRFRSESRLTEVGRSYSRDIRAHSVARLNRAVDEPLIIGNSPSTGRSDRLDQSGRRTSHGCPPPQRRPMMVPSIEITMENNSEGSEGNLSPKDDVYYGSVAHRRKWPAQRSEHRYDGYGGRDRRSPDYFEESELDDLPRIFVALFDYDPLSMSPNPDAGVEELPFKEGQIIKVFGEKDTDGFYRAEICGRRGLIPCNMVSEIQTEDDEMMDQLLKQGFLPLNTPVEKIERNRRSGRHPVSTRRMVALYDYDPRESSPNVDVEAELTFCAGDVITVYGEIDEDGFYYGELNGHKGLVPSNFLEEVPDDVEVYLTEPSSRHPQDHPGRTKTKR